MSSCLCVGPPGNCPCTKKRDWAAGCNAREIQQQMNNLFRQLLDNVSMGRDPGDESDHINKWHGPTFIDLDEEDTPEDRDNAGKQAADAEVAAEEAAQSGRLMDLAKRCDNADMRDEAIESLEGVVRSHQPPPPPVFRKW